MPDHSPTQVLVQLFRSIRRLPARLPDLLRFRHFRTLWYALRHETPREILQNMHHFLKGGTAVASGHFLVHQPEQKIFLEAPRSLSTVLELAGWCYCPTDQIRAITILHQDRIVGSLRTHLYRYDLEKRHGPDYARTGFFGLVAAPQPEASYQIQFQFERSTATFPVRIIPDQKAYAYWRSLENHFRPSLPQIRRFLRTLPQLPVVEIRMTPQQQRELCAEDYPFSVIGSGETGADLTVQLHPNSRPAADLLWQVVYAYAKSDSSPDLLYWDEDQLEDGVRKRPHLKPEWSWDYLLAWNYIGYNIAYPAQRQSGLCHPLDLISRKDRVVRIPLILSHQTGPQLRTSWEKALRDRYLPRQIPGVRTEPALVPGTFRVVYPIADPPAVTIIIPFRDEVALLQTCVAGLRRFTTYPNWRVRLVNNQSQQPETSRYLASLPQEDHRFSVVDYDHPFNYADLHNQVIEGVRTPMVLLLNNDVVPRHTGWLTAMVEYAQQDRVGAVGAQLLFPNDTIQHSGVITGIKGGAEHAHRHYPADAPGYANRAQTVQQWSACTAACLLLRTQVYRDMGGMDAETFPIAFNDVDLCLRLRQHGYDIIYTPHARLYHHESFSRGEDMADPDKRERAQREIASLQKRWQHQWADSDPYYHPRLSHKAGQFKLI